MAIVLAQAMANSDWSTPSVSVVTPTQNLTYSVLAVNTSFFTEAATTVNATPWGVGLDAGWTRLVSIEHSPVPADKYPWDREKIPLVNGPFAPDSLSTGIQVNVRPSTETQERKYPHPPPALLP